MWARVLCLFTAVIPVVAGGTAAIELSHSLPRTSTVAGTVLRVLFVAVVSTVIVFAVDKAARRLLPLVALYRLSLVFPDHAPSRFRTALKAGSSRRVERLLAETRQHGLPKDPGQAARRVVELINAIGDHDRRTRGHSERVRLYADLIGEELRLPKQDRQKLQWAALLHDLGKLAVPGEILNKTGKPTAEEWEILRTHPAAGEKLIKPLRAFLGTWADAIGGHHEWWDGTGYPRQLQGDQISRSAAIVAVADAYEVMTAVRSYKKSMPASAARAELTRGAGVQFSPEVVRAFLCVSLGKLRWAAGPAASLAQLPYVGSAVRLPATVSTAIQGAGSVAAAAVPSMAAVMVATTAVAASIAVTPQPHSTQHASTYAFARTAAKKGDHSGATTPKTDGVGAAGHAGSSSHKRSTTPTTARSGAATPAAGAAPTTDNSPAADPSSDTVPTTTDSTVPAPVTDPVIVSIGDVAIPEGDSGTRVLAFPVTLSQPSDSAVSVQYTVTPATATASDAATPHAKGTDGSGTSDDSSASESGNSTNGNVLKTGNVTFAITSSGKTAMMKKVYVTIRSDTDVEPDETFNVTLSDPTGGVLGRSVATGTILNDDGFASGITVGVGDTSVVRSHARPIVLTVPVWLSAPATDAVSVSFTLNDGTATSSSTAKGGGDYGADAMTGVLDFEPGTIVQYVQVKIWPSANPRPDCAFTISLTYADGGTTLLRSVGTVTILGG